MAVADHESSQAQDLVIRPLSPAIGIEVQGSDLAQPLDDEAFARIRRAWEENCIVLFRGQSLDEAAQVRFASQERTFTSAMSERVNQPNLDYLSASCDGARKVRIAAVVVNPQGGCGTGGIFAHF